MAGLPPSQFYGCMNMARARTVILNNRSDDFSPSSPIAKMYLEAAFTGVGLAVGEFGVLAPITSEQNESSQRELDDNVA